MTSRRELGSTGFGNGALYDEVRPDYPREAIEYFVRTFGLDATTTVVDLGAGSGIFTRQIRHVVGHVTAIEPSASMRQTFRATTPEIDVLDGTDVSIPLLNSAVDVVFVAQAFHWFDRPRALVEIHRVLRPGGGLGLIWNERDESVPWVRELGEAMRWPEYQPYEVGRDFSEDILSGPFQDVERAHFSHVQYLSKEQLRRRVLTTSYVSVMDESERREILSDVEVVVRSLPEALSLPYDTDVYRARAS